MKILLAIDLVAPEMACGERLGGREMAGRLYEVLKKHDINLVTDFPISRITKSEVLTPDGDCLGYDLLMLIPPFSGASAGVGYRHHGYRRLHPR